MARAHGIQGEVAVRAFDPGSETLDQRGARARAHPLGRGARAAHRVRAAHAQGGHRRHRGRGVARGRRGAGGRRRASSTARTWSLPPRASTSRATWWGSPPWTRRAQELGKVEEIWNTGEVPNLVIRAEGKPELIVPFADEFVPTVDVPGGKLVIRPAGVTWRTADVPGGDPHALSGHGLRLRAGEHPRQGSGAGEAVRHRHRHPRVRRGQAPRHRRHAVRRRRRHGDEGGAAGGRSSRPLGPATRAPRCC